MPGTLYKKLFDLELLKRAWHLSRASARTDFIFDCYRYSDFAFNLEDNLKSILHSLKTGTYHPKPLLKIDVPKSSLTVRPGSVPEIEDKIVTFAIIYLIAPILDKELPDTVYSYRLKAKPDRDDIFEDKEVLEFTFLKKKTIQKRIQIIEPWYGQWPKFDSAVRYAYEEEGYNYLSVSDISAYFENIHLDILRDKLLKYLPNEQKLVNLLISILEFWTWRTHEGKNLGRGLPQGNTASSFIANIYLLPLDRAFKTFSKKYDVKYFRYMDDVKILSKEENVARSVIFRMNEVLRDIHLNIQGSKTVIYRDKEIRDELIDERLDDVNRIIVSFEGKTKTLNKEEVKEYVTKFKKAYQGIKKRNFTIKGKDLRLFRRILTGLTFLENNMLVERTLKELPNNPDYRLMNSAIRYFRCFPAKKKISNEITNFIKSPINLFSYQEAQMLLCIRYFKEYPKKIIEYARNIYHKKDDDKHWYIRCQAILLLSYLPLQQKTVVSLQKHYNVEINIEVKRALVAPLCQLEQENQYNFLREIVFDPSPKISRLARMLIYLREKEDIARKEINDILGNYDEIRIMDTFYKLDVIKHSKSNTVKKYLYKMLKSKRRFLTHTHLKNKVNKMIEFLE